MCVVTLLSKSQLFRCKCVTTLYATRIDGHLSIRYLYGKSIQSPGGRRIFYITMHIEAGGVAGAKETILIGLPIDLTTKVRTAAIDGQEATLWGSNQKKTTSGKFHHRAGQESIDRPGLNQTAKFSLQAARLHEEQTGAANF
jgi:hypothetical protein